jgi:hypothetical protein
MTSRTPSLTEIDGASIVESALCHAAKKTGIGSVSDTVASVSRGEVETYLHFRYGLAKEAARQLARMCDGIDAALVFLENRCESYPGDPVLMGLLVSRKTAALEALVESISEAVRSEVAKRLPAMAEFEAVLVIEMIDVEEASKRRGLAALLGSLSEPPIQVWPQE